MRDSILAGVFVFAGGLLVIGLIIMIGVLLSDLPVMQPQPAVTYPIPDTDFTYRYITVDGMRCVVVEKPNRTYGFGIDCDWER